MLFDDNSRADPSLGPVCAGSRAEAVKVWKVEYLNILLSCVCDNLLFLLLLFPFFLKINTQKISAVSVRPRLLLALKSGLTVASSRQYLS